MNVDPGAIISGALVIATVVGSHVRLSTRYSAHVEQSARDRAADRELIDVRLKSIENDVSEVKRRVLNGHFKLKADCKEACLDETKESS